MHISPRTLTTIGITAAVGIGLVALAGCGADDPEPTVDETARGTFGSFERDEVEGISISESVRSTSATITGTKHEVRRTSSRIYYEQKIGHQNVTRSILDAVEAADALGAGPADGIATWAELAALVATFDSNADGSMNAQERTAFSQAYGVHESRGAKRWTGTRESSSKRSTSSSSNSSSGRSSSSSRPSYPSVPSGGHTSPGDSHGSSSYPSVPSSGRTSSGDSGGSSRPSSGNSSSNGNPSDSDF